MGLKSKEIAEALRSLLSRPYTIRYPAVPSPPPEPFRGIPEFNERCMGCGACEQVCPAGAITVKDEGNTREIEVNYGNCIRCGQCASSCPVEGIKLSTKYCIVSAGQREGLRMSVKRKLIRCEDCGDAITAEDHLKWITEVLGPLSYSNSSLIRFSHLILGEVTASSEALFRLLCPRCRRQRVLADHGWRAKY